MGLQTNPSKHGKDVVQLMYKQSKDTMRGYDEIIAAYDKDTMEEIVRHGCSSGVCSQHIYYGDTNRFYDNHEDEILDYFEGMYDEDFLVNLFKDANANLGIYKNYVTWAYIEAISCDVTCELDEQESDSENPYFHMDKAFNEALLQETMFGSVV